MTKDNFLLWLWQSISLIVTNGKLRRRLMIGGIACFALLWYAWTHGMKHTLYQWVYGQSDRTPLTITATDILSNVEEQPEQTLKIHGKTITLQLVKKFQTTARVAWIDRYTKAGTYYRASPGAELYDTVVPLDLSLATGKTAEQFDCFDFKHEYRTLVATARCGWLKDTEISNNHTIPANKRIRKGLEILKPGDIVQVEGYLAYWQGTGDDSVYRFESATQLGQKSPKIAAGQRAILCRQLLLTRITFDGYTFE